MNQKLKATFAGGPSSVDFLMNECSPQWTIFATFSVRRQWR
jgi:hypothetical protein